MSDARVTYVGGPTALIALDGLLLLTDPTFDPAGTAYATPAYTLRKQQAPALAAADLPPLDAVLLSHDHHADNLDTAGRRLLDRAPLVLTTREGAARLRGRSVGLEPRERIELAAPSGRTLAITATPARHGPAGGDRGPVVGFALQWLDAPGALYLSGDTVWYDGVAEVARRFDVRTAMLFTGAARVAAAGPAPLTFTAEEAVAAARAFDRASIAPLHYEGWEHFSASRAQLDEAFARAGPTRRLRWLAPGREARLPMVAEAAAAAA